VRSTNLRTVKGPPVTNNGTEIVADEKIPDEKYVELNLPGDQMFQRWIIDKVFHRHEMRFERGSLDPIVGFLTGIDSMCYSISTTASWPPLSHIVPRHVVTGISETGRSLHDLDRRFEPLINKYTRRLRTLCEEELIPARKMMRDRARQNSI